MFNINKTFNKLTPPALVEIFFDIAYLAFALVAGLILIVTSDGEEIIALYGILALVLALGDSFHLIPRVYSLITDTMEQNTKALGFGKAVTSITMTAFYLILYFIWGLLYKIDMPVFVTGIVIALAVVRVALCLSPKNGWLLKDPPVKFAIYRNIPFVILGLVITSMFILTAAYYNDGFKFMWLAITLSFLCYLIVVIKSPENKKFGAFMLPKTCAYIWIISMGFSIMR